MKPNPLSSLHRLIGSLPVRPFFVTVSGSHLYGFPSPDSDVDLRGAYLPVLEEGFGPPRIKETFELQLDHDGREVDTVLHVLRKFIRLMAGGDNGYVLEQVMSPLVVTAPPSFEEFRELARGCLCRRILNHFLGFFHNQVALFEKEQPKRAKTLLYCYRSALAGIHALRVGRLESNLLSLNEVFGLPYINELVSSEQLEGSSLEEAAVEGHRRHLQELEAQLRQAHCESSLPDEPINAEALNEFLVRVTLREAGVVKKGLRLEASNLLLGTQVVTRVDKRALTDDNSIKAGNVGVVLQREAPESQGYLVRVLDGREAAYQRCELALHRREAEDVLSQFVPSSEALEERVLYDCILGSRAYGLATSQSDEDHRGIYLAPLELLHSLWGAPEQIGRDDEHVYWELKKFLHLALQSNPNALECLWTPLIVRAHRVAEELRSMREAFLSRNLFRTFGGYAMSQFKKMEGDVRQHGRYRPKHALHLIRLLMAGATALREGLIPVDMSSHRDRLLPILSGELSFEEVAQWRRKLEEDFNAAFEQTVLPDHPDVERVNDFMTRVRGMQAREEL